MKSVSNEQSSIERVMGKVLVDIERNVEQRGMTEHLKALTDTYSALAYARWSLNHEAEPARKAIERGEAARVEFEVHGEVDGSPEEMPEARIERDMLKPRRDARHRYECDPHLFSGMAARMCAVIDRDEHGDYITLLIEGRRVAVVTRSETIGSGRIVRVS